MKDFIMRLLCKLNWYHEHALRVGGNMPPCIVCAWCSKELTDKKKEEGN